MSKRRAAVMIDFLLDYEDLAFDRSKQMKRELTEPEELLLFINFLRVRMDMYPLTHLNQHRPGRKYETQNTK